VSRLNKAVTVGLAVAIGGALIGLLVGAAIQVNHPHRQSGWDASYWLSGSLLGLALGLLVGAFVAMAVWETSR